MDPPIHGMASLRPCPVPLGNSSEKVVLLQVGSSSKGLSLSIRLCDNFFTLFVLGFGVSDPVERHETLKAMEKATTLIFPSYKDLQHNEQAVDVLRQSRFVKEGRAFAIKAANAQGEEPSQQVPDATDSQHVVILSYPERERADKHSVKVSW